MFITVLCKCVATLGAAVWFFMTVYSFMLLEITFLSEFVVALGAVVWCIIALKTFMLLEITFLFINFLSHLEQLYGFSWSTEVGFEHML